MSPGYSRRKFLKGSAAAAGVAALTGISSSPFVLAQRSPADKLRVAVIGQGHGRLQHGLRPGARISWPSSTWTKRTSPRS